MKSIIFLSIFILISSIFLINVAADSGVITLPAFFTEVTDTSGTANSGLWTNLLNYTNITDANLTTYGAGTNATYFFNFSKIFRNDTTNGTVVQFKYNTSAGPVTTNYTLSDYPNCWEGHPLQVIIKVDSNKTFNVSNLADNETIIFNNASGVLLANTRVVNSTSVLYNRSGPRTVVNESDASNLIWKNNSNMTLAYPPIVVSSVSLYNCSNTSFVVGLGDYIAYTNGTIFMLTNATFPHDGDAICADYTGTSQTSIIHHNNYSIDFETGNLTASANADTNLNGATLGINYSYLTLSDESNSRYCYNSTDWLQLGVDVGRTEIFDARTFFKIGERNTDLRFTLTTPDAYAITTSAAMLFNFTATDVLADENHTEFNCTLSTSLDRSVALAANISDMPVTNGSWVNKTITFQDQDRVRWQYSCEDEHERLMGTSDLRIFDVDIFYMTLGLGANRLINFTLDTGRISLAGNFTMFSPGGTQYNCGVSDGGAFACN